MKKISAKTVESKNGYDLQLYELSIDIKDGETATALAFRVVTSSKPVRIISDFLGTIDEARTILNEQPPIATKTPK